MITDINQLDLSKRYTYADYLTWQFDEMVELIRGRVFRMSPAPGSLHQQISAELHFQIMAQIRSNPCKAFAAPFDVRLPVVSRQQSIREDTVVQPDICVICDLEKLDARGCNGAPDWIIEILSKSTAEKDLKEKFDLYESAGVREYWIVFPSEGTVMPYRLQEDGAYHLLRQTPFVKGEKVPVGIFPGFEVDLGEVFDND